MPRRTLAPTSRVGEKPARLSGMLCGHAATVQPAQRCKWTGRIGAENASRRRPDGVRRCLDDQLTTRRQTRAGRDRDSAPMGSGLGGRGSAG